MNKKTVEELKKINDNLVEILILLQKIDDKMDQLREIKWAG